MGSYSRYYMYHYDSAQTSSGHNQNILMSQAEVLHYSSLCLLLLVHSQCGHLICFAGS
jgi:hypothetical protein